MTTRYRNNAPLGAALGLQPGELYEGEEECHSHIVEYEHLGRKFEVFYDELAASSLSHWKTFCMGIGTRSWSTREGAIRAMQVAIENANKETVIEEI